MEGQKTVLRVSEELSKAVEALPVTLEKKARHLRLDSILQENEGEAA